MKTLVSVASATLLALIMAQPAAADDSSRLHLSNPNGSVAGGGGLEAPRGGDGMAGHGGGNFSGSKTKAGYANSGAPRPGGYVGGGNDGYGSGGKDGAVVSHSAPGPILGLGIPALVVAGGYVLLRRRRK